MKTVNFDEQYNYSLEKTKNEMAIEDFCDQRIEDVITKLDLISKRIKQFVRTNDLTQDAVEMLKGRCEKIENIKQEIYDL